MRRVLLDHGAARARSTRCTDPVPIEDAADAYDALDARAARRSSFVHLGLGPDGHTASLFPGSPALDDRRTGSWSRPATTCIRIRASRSPSRAIARSPLVVVTVGGAEKRDAMQRIAAGEDLPAARVDGDHVLWFVDEAAAP